MSLIPYQTYKLTNLQWIERLPYHWELKALKHCIARLGSGGTPESGNPDYWTDEDDEEGVPWVSIGDMTTKPIVMSTQKRITSSGLASKGLEIFPVGSLLYSIYASLGKVATLGIDAAFNQAILAIVPDETTVSQSSLCYWLQSLEAHLAYYASSNTQSNLNAAKVLSYPVALPSQEEQLAIASFLDRETAKIDALIAEQQRLIELLQEKRQAVISHAVTKGLNPNAPMKDSGVEWLGEVPEHWEVMGLTKTIGPVVDYRGKTPTKCDSGTLLVTAKNIRNGEIDYTLSEEYVDPLEAEQLLQRGRPVIGDVLFTMEAPLGQVALVDREDIALAQRVVKFRGISGRMTNDFLMWWLIGSHCQHQLNSLSTGSIAVGIKASKLSAVACVVPPVAEQVAITKRIRDMSKQIASIYSTARSQIDLLQERRSALISAAVTGQIDVRGLATEEEP